MRDPFVIASSTTPPRLRVGRMEIPDTLPTPQSSSGYLGSQLSRRRLVAGYVVMMFGLGSLGVRTAYLQLVSGEHLRAVAEGNRIRILPVPAVRGQIIDRYGVALVKHVPNIKLEVTPVDLPRDEATRADFLQELATTLERPADVIANTLRELDFRSYEPVTIAEQLTHDQAVRAKIIAAHVPALRLTQAASRRYVTDGAQSLSHILGYLGRIEPGDVERLQRAGYAPGDTIGKSGIELAVEKVLAGTPGREQIEVDATGRKKELIAYQPPVAGSTLALTIDVEAQRQLEQVLRAELEVRRLTRAAAVVLDPQNGEILALVSLPAYDNNVFARGIQPEELAKLAGDADRPLFNRAIQGTYPPGSTVKPVIAAAALQEGVITPRTTFQSVGGVRVNEWFFPDWKTGGHGPTNLTLALSESVNTYFYYVGGGYRDFLGLGVERMQRYLRQAGLGSPLGIELAGEASGLVPDPAWKVAATGQPWYIGDTYHLAIGQGDLLVTPLQVAAFTAVIANGGTLFRPHLIREITPAGAPLGTRPPVVTLQAGLFSAEHLAAVRSGLRQTVKNGSARQLASIPLAIAGKTGTAQWASNRNHHAWFTGYAPADSPRIVVTIMVEEGGEGSATAVPVAGRFFSWWADARQ